jgi:dihydrofolate reductase
MSRVVVIQHLTLDGVMQAPGHPDEDPRDGFAHGGWAQADNDQAMQEVLGARMGPSWSLLLGRTTYDRFADFWPKQAPNPFTEALTQARKYVASTTLSEPLPWANSEILKGDVPQAVAALRDQPGGNLVIFGSGVLVRSLMRRDLIDEFVLQVHPLVLGSGRPPGPGSALAAALPDIPQPLSACPKWGAGSCPGRIRRTPGRSRSAARWNTEPPQDAAKAEQGGRHAEDRDP